MKGLVSISVMALVMVMLAGSALAVPRLQTYIVGSNYYDFYGNEHDSWITRSTAFDLKVVGYWQPAGGGSSMLSGKDPRGGVGYDYMDCYLMLSAPTNESGTVWIDGVELTGFGSYASTVPAGVNANPSLRYHMPAGIGVTNFVSIGRIDNDEIKAFDYSHGIIGTPGWGDEKLVHVETQNYSWVHFDAVGVDSYGNTFVNPYSHDASYYGKPVPEPGTLSLLGLGLLGMIPILRKKRD